ncbi:TolC family protein [Nitrosophilus labii]|uniref:TolC family protein n=1 Tax=Nitrosophilus labii TaxID=2706014 RepID=UPI0016573D0C|nr:TolC family protein [Nitrosophilus labii]
MRLLSIFLLLPIFLWANVAVDFETFKNMALKESLFLKNRKLKTEISKKEKEIALRYKNPTFELETSRFDTELDSIKNGYRGTISQPVRLFGVSEELKSFSNAKISLSVAIYKKQKANFLKILEKAYTDYVYKKRLLGLIKEELEIAKKVVLIAKERYKNGTGTKAKFLQASLERAEIENAILSYENELFMTYQNLLSIAGIKKKVALKDAFLYDFSSIKLKNLKSPEVKIASKKREFYLKEAKISKRLIKEIDIFAEYEKEPEQKIARFGVALELPLFNLKKEEEQIARIKALQSLFEGDYIKNFQSIKIDSLRESLKNLKNIYHQQKKLLKKEMELLELFKEGYAISKGSLLDLLDAKNRLLKTKRKILSVMKKCNDYIIELNYLQGFYNE